MCSTCSKPTYRNQSSLEGHKNFYCSKACRVLSSDVACKQCGILVRKKRCHLQKQLHAFCSVQCGATWRREWLIQHPEERAKISIRMTGKKQSEETIRKRVAKNKGRKRTEEMKALMRKNAPREEQSHSWKGGKSPLNYRLRRSSWMKDWRNAVFARDNWTCVDCGSRGGILNAHHLVPFKDITDYIFTKTRDFEEIIKWPGLWDISNGVTLCVGCHRMRHFCGLSTVKNIKELKE